MARIDLTSIPNAPDIGSPVMQQAAPGIDQGTLEKPIQALQGASEASGRFAKLNQQEGMNIDAFSGEAKGMEAIGKGIGTLADPLNQLSTVLDRAQVASDMAKVDVVLKQHSSSLDQARMTTPYDQWGQQYQDSIPELQKQIDGLNLSPRAKLMLQPDLTKYLAMSSIGVQGDMLKAKIQDQKQTILNAAQTCYDSGDYQGAMGHIQAAADNHLMTQPQADAEKEKYVEDARKQGWQQVISNDPLQSLQHLDEDVKAGKSDWFQGANPVQLNRLQEQARGEVNRQRIDAIRGVENQIDSGAITNNDQLKAADPTGILDPVSLQGLQTRMKNTTGPDPATWMRIQNDIQQLDPKDPEFQQDWLDIKADVNQNVGSQWRGSMESQLYQKITQNQKGQGQTVDEKISAAGFQRIKYLTENGAFGQFEVKKDPKTGAVDPTQLAAQQDAYGKAMSMNDALTTAIKEGKIPNSYSGMNAWINDQMTDAQKKILGNKLNQPDGPGVMQKAGNFLEDPIGTMQGNPAPPYSIYDEAKARSGEPKASPTPLPAGAIPAPAGSKVTNYWPSETGGTDGWIGNHGNMLSKGDFGASPDVQASLKSHGAKLGDTVLIHLADGDTIPAKFNDSTAQDADRLSKGKQPLRGRFDMWTKTKGHAKDGVAVLGYSLPNKQS